MNARVALVVVLDHVVGEGGLRQGRRLLTERHALVDLRARGHDRLAHLEREPFGQRFTMRMQRDAEGLHESCTLRVIGATPLLLFAMHAVDQRRALGGSKRREFMQGDAGRRIHCAECHTQNLGARPHEGQAPR